MNRLFLTAAFGAFALASPASATSYCEVVKTKDGFAALRATPGASGKLLAKMPSESMVLLRGQERSGWAKVAWCREGQPEQDCKGQIEGWVNKKLIDVCG